MKFHLTPDGKGVVGVDGNDVIQQFDLATGKASPREDNYLFSTKAACQRRGDLVITGSLGGSAAGLRGHFVRTRGVPPQAYRRTFRTPTGT